MKMLINPFKKIALKTMALHSQQKQWAVIAFLALVLGLVQEASAEYLIGSNDALSIKVYGYEDLTTETRVSDQGLIMFPLIGEVKIGGKSTLEASRTIAQLLSHGGFIRGAQVSVVVLDYKSQQVAVLGQVNKPGQYALELPSTLVDVIAMAGGINPSGEDRVIITRRVNGVTVKKDIDLRKVLEFPEASSVEPIEKGDIVYVPKAPVFYIQGEAQRPGSFKLEANMTVAQALSLGGGLTPRGTLRGIVIERRDQKGKTKTIDVGLSDLVLKDDVVVIDERLF
jgi:polysaccharide export outer membrane protein